MKRVTHQELLRIGGEPVRIKVRVNPRARRLIVKVHPSTGEVAVVAPSSRVVPRAIDFARSERDWIAERLSRVPPLMPLEPGHFVPFRGRDHVIRHVPQARGVVWLDAEAARPTLRVTGQVEHVPRRIEDWLKKEARKELVRRVEVFATALGVKPKRVNVRDSSSRWGSCSTTGTLSFSWRLILAPPFVLDYVAAHEVAHLKEMNHGPRFWRLVEHLVGDSARSQDWLREHGSVLHRYGSAVDGRATRNGMGGEI
ncbi:MAG: M48 family metallopeptidase [Alphaproteobacteria bacterium]|nr:M48 family metallopeptidase [Alphaproteobacteria bacterium]